MSNILDLTNQLVSESFEDLVQHKEGILYDGLGNLLFTINQNNVGNVVASYRSDINSLIIYSGYLLNSVATIKKCNYNIITYAVDVIDLETDWINRLNLIYI